MSPGKPPPGKTLRKANPNTIQNKFLVGYQGWFTCAGDGPPVHEGHHGWVHWFGAPIPDGGHINTDLWPDTSDYSPSELYPAPGLTLQDGRPACLFSSRHPKTVQRHFHWMAQHGVDGAFLQRFAGQLEVDGKTEGTTYDLTKLRDEVGDRVQEAAEKSDRVFAIMYDVSGVDADRIEKVIKVDWAHLVHDKGVLDSPSYLREKGKPVIALWGFGFEGRGHDPAVVREIVRHLKATTPGGAYVMAGAPTHWQTLTGDADPNPAFLDVWYNVFDAISPWTVGRYGNEDDADGFAIEKVRKDMAALKNNTGGRKVDYIPVVLPGGSGWNMSEGQWGLNDIKRNGGRFLWRQIYNVRREGANIIYGAMWDEYDEGTAFLPVVSSKSQLPTPGKYLALDADGYDLPSDWYMRICGLANEGLRGERDIQETFPVKELQDYWSSRPHYEDFESDAAGGSSGSQSQPFAEWSKEQNDVKEEVPPPPYTLEASEEVSVPSNPPAPPPPSRRPSVPAPQPRSSSMVAPAVNVGTRPQPVNDRSNSVSRSSSMDQSPQPVSSVYGNPISQPGHSPSISGPHAPPVPRANKPAAPRPNDHQHYASQQLPHMNQHHYPRPPSAPSVSSLADNFSRQSLTDTPPPQGSFVPPVGQPPSQEHASLSGGQWPPAEWQTSSPQPPRPTAPYSTYTPAYRPSPPPGGTHGSASHVQRPGSPVRFPHSPPMMPHDVQQPSYGPSGPSSHVRPPISPQDGPQSSSSYPSSSPSSLSMFPQPHWEPDQQAMGGYFPQPHQQQPQQHPYYPSPYPPSEPFGGNYSQPHFLQAQYAQPTGPYPPPPIPPRWHGDGTPPASYPSQGGGGPSAGSFSSASGAAGRGAGNDRRTQFEKSVDSLTRTGSKLFDRFLK